MEPLDTPLNPKETKGTYWKYQKECSQIAIMIKKDRRRKVAPKDSIAYPGI